MARVEVNIPPAAAGPEIYGADSFIVRIKKEWAGDWEAVDYLTPLSARVSAGPGVSRAMFNYDYGENTREDRASFAIEPPLELKDQFIQIVLQNEFGTSVLWTGVIADRVYDVDSSLADPDAFDEAKVLSGRQTITAYGLEHLLDQATIRGGHIWNAADSRVDEIAHLPIFNQRQRYGLGGSGNRSTAPPADGIHVFSEDGAVWTNKDILEYILHYHKDGWGDTAGDLQFTITGQPELLDNILTLHKLEGLTVFQAVNHLIARHRGIGWCIWAPGNISIEGRLEASPGPVAIHIFSIFGDDIKIGGTTIRGNKEVTSFPLDAREIKRALIKHSTSSRYHRIIVQGARVKSCFTVSSVDDTLEAGWTYTEENLYNAALGTDPDLNDAYRQEDGRARVYQVYRIPHDFDWMVKNGLGTGGAFTANPTIKEDGRLDVATTAKYWNVNRALLRDLPIASDAGADDTEPEMLKPLVVVYNSDDDLYHQVEGLKAIEKPPARVRMLDGEMAFSVEASIGHVMGLVAFDPTTDGPTKINPEFNWKQMIATVFAETDERLRVIQTDPGFSDQRPRTLTLNVPDAELWYIAPQTVIGVSKGVLQHWASSSYTLRDDGARLRTIAAIAMAWYRRERTAIEVKFDYLRTGDMLGTYIEKVGDETNSTAVGTIVSSLDWDFVHASSILRTSYWELDVARVAEVPGMSNLRAVARTIHGMQDEMIELRRHVGNLPVRWPGVSAANNIAFGKGQEHPDKYGTGAAWKATGTPGIAEVKVQFCDEDGDNVTGDTFTIYCYHPTSMDPNIRVDMVIPYTTSKSGRLVTLADFADDPIGTVKIWLRHSAGDPIDIRPGWVLAAGTSEWAVDLQDVFIGGYKDGGTHFPIVGTGGNKKMIDQYDTNFPFMTIAFIERVN